MFCRTLPFMLGLHTIKILLDRGPRVVAIRLDDGVKKFIIDFLGQIETNRVDENWLSFPNHPGIKKFLPYSNDHVLRSESLGYRYTTSVMMWHAATWFCQAADEEQEEASHMKRAAGTVAGRFRKAKETDIVEIETKRHRCLAIALSKYCAYLVVSAPELLPGSEVDTKHARRRFESSARRALCWDKDRLLAAMSDLENNWTAERNIFQVEDYHDSNVFWDGVCLAKQLLGNDLRRSDDAWRTLALVWVRMLLYAAPYGSVEAHRQRLRQGGEFITHLYALLYHLDIREWIPPDNQHHRRR